MILAALMLPVAVAAILILVDRLRVPTYLALMAVAVGYGVAANMLFVSIPTTFGTGFATALQQTGLMVVAGGLLGVLSPARLPPWPATAAAAIVAGLGAFPAGGLALMLAAGSDAAPALTVLVVNALIPPSPMSLAALSVMRVTPASMFAIGAPVAAIVVGLIWFNPWRKRTDGAWSWAWLALAVPLLLLLSMSVANLPIYPMGTATPFFRGLASPLVIAVLAVALAVLLSGRWQPERLADLRWAPLLLTVGAAGGFSRVLDQTGMAELLAERVLDPRLGLLVPCLAAAVVKTLQGNSFSAVLTATGMVEPMLAQLGLDSPTGRALAAAAASAGSIAICHVNDPLFWIAGHMAGLAPAKALRTISLGSAVIAAVTFLLLLAVRQLV